LVSYVQLASSGRVDLSLNGREEQLYVFGSVVRASEFEPSCVARLRVSIEGVTHISPKKLRAVGNS